MASISRNRLANIPGNSSAPQTQNTASTAKKSRPKPIKWTPKMEEAMLDALLDAQNKGLQTDNTAYKASGWQLALEAIQKCTTYSVQLLQVKSKHDSQKKDWKVWKEFTGQSGFGWDDETGIPTSDEDILEAYFDAHPEARKFREKPLAFASKLAILLNGHLATGEQCRTVPELFAEADDENAENMDEVELIDNPLLFESEEFENIDDYLRPSVTIQPSDRQNLVVRERLQ